MGRRKRDDGLATFNQEAAQNGITYAEAQKRETQKNMKRIRAPKTKRTDGTPVYMTVAARNRLKRLEADSR